MTYFELWDKTNLCQQELEEVYSTTSNGFRKIIYTAGKIKISIFSPDVYQYPKMGTVTLENTAKGYINISLKSITDFEKIDLGKGEYIFRIPTEDKIYRIYSNSSQVEIL